MDSDMQVWVLSAWLLVVVVVSTDGGSEVSHGLACDFERSSATPCSWAWNASVSRGFTVVNASQLRQDPFYRGPIVDGSYSSFGNFTSIAILARHYSQS